MLTRLEVDGFKNLLNVDVEFGPYTCIAGQNAVGKSNLFDAIQFLSLLANHTFLDATQMLRAGGERLADPRMLFWMDGGRASETITFAAEMIVPEVVEDDFGREARAKATFLRYELVLKYSPPEQLSLSQLGTISLQHESLTYIRKSDAPSRLKWPHSKKNFRDHVMIQKKFGTGFISTSIENEQPVIKVHQDGGSRGQPRSSPAVRAPRTVISTTNSNDDPTILAARREMQQWRLLSLEPTSMRAPGSFTDRGVLARTVRTWPQRYSGWLSTTLKTPTRLSQQRPPC